MWQTSTSIICSVTEITYLPKARLSDMNDRTIIYTKLTTAKCHWSASQSSLEMITILPSGRRSRTLKWRRARHSETFASSASSSLTLLCAGIYECIYGNSMYRLLYMLLCLYLRVSSEVPRLVGRHHIQSMSFIYPFHTCVHIYAFPHSWQLSLWCNTSNQGLITKSVNFVQLMKTVWNCMVCFNTSQLEVLQSYRDSYVFIIYSYLTYVRPCGSIRA